MKHSARILAAFALALPTLATTAHAFTIQGTLKNGTTGASNIGARIVAIVPSEGMREVGAVDVKDGSFTLENLPDGVPMVMLRTEYAGVTYNTTVPVTGGNQNIEVEVFEVTKSWDGVKVVVPHLAVTRSGNRMQIEQLYEVTNETSPAKTLGAFQMWLPSDMDSIIDCYVISGEIPVKRMPVPTDKKDIYSIDYPVRPGMTRFGISYTVPYADSKYTMRARYPVAMSHMMVFAVDSSMQVMSTTHEFVSQQAVHGMTAYSLHGITANDELILNFAGGDPHFAGVQVQEEGHSADDGHNHGATPENIRVASSEDYKISIFVMISVLLVLTGIVGMAMRDGHDPLSDAKVLRAHYDLLVSRLAKLDDLHAANTIPSDAYRASREELMGRLAALAIQLRTHGGVHPSGHGAHTAAKSKAQ